MNDNEETVFDRWFKTFTDEEKLRLFKEIGAKYVFNEGYKQGLIEASKLCKSMEIYFCDEAEKSYCEEHSALMSLKESGSMLCVNAINRKIQELSLKLTSSS